MTTDDNFATIKLFSSSKTAGIGTHSKCTVTLYICGKLGS